LAKYDADRIILTYEAILAGISTFSSKVYWLHDLACRFSLFMA